MASDNLEPDSGQDKKFYVYIYRDPRPKAKLAPIYVGKGTGRRFSAHWKTKKPDNPFLAAILAKIRAASLEPIIEIISWFDADAEVEAFALERELVARFGRRNIGAGTLVNLTDGGEGTSGCFPTPEMRAARSSSMKDKLRDDPQLLEAAVKNLDAGRARMRSSPELQKKRIASLLAKRASDPSIGARQSAKMRANRRAEMANEASKDSFVEAMVNGRKTEWAANPEKRAACCDKLSIATSASWSDPNFRANLVKKNSATMKAMWADPDYRSKNSANLSACFKAAWADPEKRALMLANRAKSVAAKKAAARG